MSYSVALPTLVHQEAVHHLLRADGQEDLCFGLWYPSRGQQRMTALVHRLIVPEPGERRVHGNASFLPPYFERALGIALREKAGLVFLHSHPTPGWQPMSQDDIRTEHERAAAVKGATGLPFVGLTLGTDGAWSGRFWEKVAARTYERRWCGTVRVVGDQLSVTYHDSQIPPPGYKRALARTISAWGPATQAALARLRIGVIGTGSVGSLVAESLARMGIVQIALMDFDGAEDINRDRSLHVSRYDVFWQQAKVQAIARALKRSATAANFVVDPFEWSIVEEEGFRTALDCDVLFSCVDNRPWARAVLNFIAYAHLIPVVDGGIAVRTKANGKLRHAYWRAHVAAPSRVCLECLDQYNAELVALERDGLLDNPGYIEGLPADHPIRRNENVFAFSAHVAAMEVLQFLSMVVAPSGIANINSQRYNFVTGRLDFDECHCHHNCFFPTIIARGDESGVRLTGRHMIAEQARGKRKDSMRHRIGTWLLDGLANFW